MYLCLLDYFLIYLLVCATSFIKDLILSIVTLLRYIITLQAGLTALMKASQNSEHATAKLLLEAGADKDARDEVNQQCACSACTMPHLYDCSCNSTSCIMHMLIVYSLPITSLLCALTFDSYVARLDALRSCMHRTMATPAS